MSWSTWVLSIFLSSIIIILVSILLFVTIGQFLFVTGNSMAPTWEDGCKIVPMDSYTGQQLEGEIIAYESDANNSLITHRVIKEYSSYNPSKHQYQLINKDTNFSDEYKGEHILIAQGDNNVHPDPELIHIDDVEAVYTTDYIIRISSSNDHPLCTV